MNDIDRLNVAEFKKRAGHSAVHASVAIWTACRTGKTWRALDLWLGTPRALSVAWCDGTATEKELHRALRAA